MAEPSGSYTMADLVMRTAEFVGLAFYGGSGNRGALVPVDQHDLDLIVRTVNEGIKMFIEDGPPEGWRWQKRMHRLTLKVATSSTATSGSATTLVDSDLAGDYADDYYNNCIIEITDGTGAGEHAIVTDYTGSSGTFTFSALSGGSTPDTTSEYTVGHRYLLPQNFAGTVLGPIEYLKESDNGTVVDWSDEATIRRAYQNSVNSGYPRIAAYRPYDHRRWELLVYPQPSESFVLEFPYQQYFAELELATGVATGGSSTTLADSTRIEADDYFNGWTITIIDGTGRGETATITDYTGSSGTFTFSALSGSSTPDTTSYYYVEPATNTHPAGLQYDRCILAACKAVAESNIGDITAGWEERYRNLYLVDAYRTNRRQAPVKLGSLSTMPRRYRRQLANLEDEHFTT